MAKYISILLVILAVTGCKSNRSSNGSFDSRNYDKEIAGYLADREDISYYKIFAISKPISIDKVTYASCVTYHARTADGENTGLVQDVLISNSSKDVVEKIKRVDNPELKKNICPRYYR